MIATHRRPHIRQWITNHRRTLTVTAVIVVAAIIVGQLLYPRDYSLPFVKINNQPTGFMHRDIVAAQLQKKFETSSLSLTVGERTVSEPVAAFGAIPNVDVMTSRLSDYPVWQRLVPLSIVMRHDNLTQLDVYFVGDKLQEESARLAKVFSIAPENARLTIEDGRVSAIPPKSGVKVTPEEIRTTLSQTSYNLATTTRLSMAPQSILATRTSADIDPLRAEAESIVSRRIVLNGLDRQFIPDNKEIASWMVVSENDNEQLELAIDDDKITQYINTINNELKIDPDRTRIELEDGREISRTVAADGRRIKSEQLRRDIIAAVEGDDSGVLIAIELEPVSPLVVYSTGYTATENGLRAYVAETARTKNVRISVRQLSGNQWTAGARETESTVSASTYKLFVALMVFDRIDKGELAWNDAMLDTNVSGCLERMIVPSTNPCAEKFIALFGGGQAVNQFIYDKGFSTATTFYGHVATHTSTADLIRFLIGLQNGTLISGNNRSILLEKMSRQLYRQGIPSGSKGPVSDKVGFLWDYINDAGIVYHPRGTYVVAVMTKGGSYGLIAEITREIERIMYP